MNFKTITHLLRLRPSFIVLMLGGALTGHAWQSSLYPESWTPPENADFYTDQLIQDFSYAGYKRGEEPLPNVTGPIFDVTDAPYGADPTGASDSTVAIQSAIDAAASAGGGVVYLPAGNYSISPQGGSCLLISSSDIVLRGDGAASTFLTNTETNMRSKQVIRVRAASVSTEAAVSITADLNNPTRRLPVATPGSFAVGDFVRLKWSFTDEWIADHNQQSYWSEATGTPVDAEYTREVVAINQAEGWIEIDAPTRYMMKVRDNARVEKINGLLSGVGIESLAIGNVQHPDDTSTWEEGDWNDPTKPAYQTHQSYILFMQYARDSWITGVESYQPAGNTSTCHMLSNGILVSRSFRITVQDCVMSRPQYGGAGGNGYMFRLSRTSESLVQNCIADFSRHGIVVSDAGTSGNVFLNCEDRETKRSTGHTGSYITNGSGSDNHMHFSHSNLWDSCHAHNSYYTASHRGIWGTIPHALTSAHGVYWNTSGSGTRYENEPIVRSEQGRYGYVIGTSGTASGASNTIDGNTAPADILEGIGIGDSLEPQSLYADQLAKRLQGLLIFMEEDATVEVTASHPLSPSVYNYGTGAASYSWTQVSGPTATFDDSASLETTVALPSEGTYVLRLTVDSGTHSVSEDITLTVFVNTAPVVEAGENQTKSNEAGQLWTPNQINTAAWYDAGDTASITASGGAVTQWNDKSGNSRHLSQLDALSRPATSNRTLNARNVLDFDGSDFMTNAGIGAEIRSLFVVFVSDQTITSSSGNQSLTSTVGDEVSSGLVLGASTGAFSGEVLTVFDEDEPNNYVDRQGVSDTTLAAINPGANFVSSVLGTNWFLGLNGSGDLRDLTSGTRNALTFTASFGVGAGLRRSDETIGFFDGGIAEILCLSTGVDASTRQNIEGYLAHKWGLSVQLPGDHPHKTAPPEGFSVTATLEGSVSDAEGHDLVISWSVVSGPAPVTFDSPNAATTTALFTLPGDYVLRLSASDGFATTVDELSVTVAEISTPVDDNTNGIDDAWELSNFGALLGEEDIRHESGVPYYFLYLAGWMSGEAVGDAGRIDIVRESSASSPIITWDFAEGFELGVHAEIWVSTDLVDWVPLPSDHYSHSTESVNGKTRHTVEVTHDYGERLFLRLQDPFYTPTGDQLIYSDDFGGDLSQWVLEQEPGGTTTVVDSQMDIYSPGGSTIWFKHKLDGSVRIEYTATMVDEGGPHDRVSDLNCFWMAIDPDHPEDLFASNQRDGSFATYDPLRLYYVGYGANDNTTTRFRRYPGDGTRPLLPEYDLSDPKFMLTANQPVRITIVTDGSTVQFLRDDEIVYDIQDPSPFTQGWFGLRTVRNHMWIDDFKIYQLGVD